MDKLVRQIHQLLLKDKLTIAVAESCTGGLVSSMLTSQPGSSAYFVISTVVYSNRAKNILLKIPLTLINRNGAVSKPVAIAMAQGIRKLANTDLAIGITGIAGPTGGTTRKPVGTVYISAAYGRKTICKKYNFLGNRSSIRRQASLAALTLLLGTLPKVPPL
jgi:nicotinamide-nucleotide amidase